MFRLIKQKKDLCLKKILPLEWNLSILFQHDSMKNLQMDSLHSLGQN